MRRAKWGLPTATHGIEAAGDAMPCPGAIASNRSQRARRLHLDSHHCPDHLHSHGPFEHRDRLAVPVAPRHLKLRNDFHLLLYSLRRPLQIAPYQFGGS